MKEAIIDALNALHDARSQDPDYEQNLEAHLEAQEAVSKLHN